MKKDLKFEKAVLRRLDVISIFLLAQKGLNQHEIGKILGMGTDTIKAIYGKNYAKILPKKSNNEN